MRINFNAKGKEELPPLAAWIEFPIARSGSHSKDPVLLVDGNVGIYIPSRFAMLIDNKTWQRRLNNADDESYWEVWEDLLNNFKYTSTDGTVWTLFESGDLWLIPDSFDVVEWGWL